MVENGGSKLRIVLADDSPDVLEETYKLLSGEFDVVGTAANGVDLVDEVRRLRPDVVVTDVSMPGVNGIEASRSILSARLCGAVVLLSAYHEIHLIDLAFEVGVRCYVLKQTAGEDLGSAIWSAWKGFDFVSKWTPA